MALETTPEPLTRHRTGLLWLVPAQAAVGLATGMLAAWVGLSPAGPNLALAVFVGIVFSQTSLLGIWGTLGMSSWWIRLTAATAGAVYLGVLLDLCLGEPYRDNHAVVAIATMLVVGVLLVARSFRVRIRLATAVTPAVPWLQFSIRHLLILTTVVACVLAVRTWLGSLLFPVVEPYLLATIGLLLATVGLLSVWPVLGASRPFLPGMLAVGIAAGLGFGLTRLSGHIAGMELEWTVIPCVEALSVVASLLVVRSCGYRLMLEPRGPKPVHRVLLLFAVWVLTTGLTVGQDRPQAATHDEQFRRLAVGTWQDEYQGKRTMTLEKDGTGTMVVELDGLKAKLFAPRLEFEMVWSVSKGRLKKRTIKGEPAVAVQLILKMLGDQVDEPILELTPERLLLLDKDGKTKYDWRRVRDP